MDSTSNGVNPNIKTVLFLLAVIAIATFFRFYSIKNTPPGLYPDEAMNGNNAVEALTTGQFKIFYPENNGREGLFINIQAFFLKLFGAPNINPEPWMLRIPSAIFGTLTVLGLYFLTRELTKNERVALLAAFLLAISFWHINFSRIGFRAITAPFYLTWSLYFLLLSLRKSKLWPSILGGLIYGAGFYSYIAYRATPLLIAVVLFLYWREYNLKEIIKIGSVFVATAFIVALPLGIYFLESPGDFLGRTSQISVFNSPTSIKDLAVNIVKTVGMFNFSGDYNWRHNISGRSELFWPVGILFLLGIFTGVKNIYKNHEDKKVFIILFSWLIITALPVVVSNEGLPHALRAIIMIPPVFVIAAISGIKLYKWLLKINNMPKFFLPVVCCLFLAALVVKSYNSYFIVWAKNPNTKGAFAQNYVDIGRLINKLPNNVQKYVLVEAQGIDVRGIPMPAQTVMFVTNTFLIERQKERNINYIAPNKLGAVPKDAILFTIN